MISNFVIFPQEGFAKVNIEPKDKLVRVTEKENAQGSKGVRAMPAMYYFIGSPKQIYRSFREARDREGYPVMTPKYQWFGVGWEAFGALAWNTNQKTVTENINQYRDLGFPLEWIVIGSGFWPREEGEFDEHGTPYGAEVESVDAQKLLATTSFGMWDEQVYPDPEGMIDTFHEQGLKVTIGLRNGFISGGPFTKEGLKNGYFMTGEDGEPKLFSVGFPEPEVYLLDAENPEAVEWYVSLYQRWAHYGVDGYKEDLFGYPQSLPDDFVNPINEAMMADSVFVMGRNNYLGSPVDIHRYNDFNYNQPQDRGPINGLAYAYSGFPNVYPDIVGGTGLASDRFGDASKSKLRVYLMRYAEYAALNPSMSFGYGPWNFDEEVVEVTRDAAALHDRLQPYIYSNAVRAAETGFPYPMTPLALAFPEDETVYGLADTTRRSYQWLIGSSLLATPLYGDDYATAESRDVYLPEGTWMEYDSGKVHEGPTTLEDYPLPVGKTPLFVGGRGIVVEEIEGELKGRLYPIAEAGEYIFYDRDAETRSRVTIDGPDWERPTVIDQATGEEVPGSWNRHAYEFPLTPVHKYRVE
jgi:alpha-glucosidase (family GH31 glycosyl hydrolase)